MSDGSVNANARGTTACTSRNYVLVKTAEVSCTLVYSDYRQQLSALINLDLIPFFFCKTIVLHVNVKNFTTQ